MHLCRTIGPLTPPSSLPRHRLEDPANLKGSSFFMPYSDILQVEVVGIRLSGHLLGDPHPRLLRAPLATLRHLLFFEKIKSTIFKKCANINNIANTYGRI
jgi:hypothetical protein